MIVQLALAFFGLLALSFAMGHNPQLRRWAPVVGLLGQPFWIAFAVSTSAWGLVVVSIAYTLVYARGAWVQWRP